MLSERQRCFAESYAADPNATAAAKAAGYAERTAYSQGQRLLKNVEVQRYIRQLQDEASAARIATMREVKAYWTETMNDPAERTADRLKASELLAKASGGFLHIRPDATPILATGEIGGEDVLIYMP